MQSLQKITHQLQALRDDLTHRIEAIDVDVHHKKEPVEKDFAEQATQRENDEVLIALGEETQSTVTLIDAALARIKEGTYGNCIKCHQPIAEQRLMALPYAETCIKCSDEAEN